MDSLYDLLLHPQTAFAEICDNKTLAQAFVIVLSATALTTVAAFAGSFQPGFFILLIGLSVAKWGITAAIWHLMAELTGGRGSVRQLLTATGFIYFIEILLIPLYLFENFLWPGSMGLTIAAGLIVALWSIILHVFAIRAVYGLSSARSSLVFALPLLLMILLAIFVICMMYSTFMAAAGEIIANPPQF